MVPIPCSENATFHLTASVVISPTGDCNRTILSDKYRRAYIMIPATNPNTSESSGDEITGVGARVAEYTHGLGERIRQVRRGIDLTQDEFGERLGVTRQSVNGYEKGRLLPPTPMIVKIADLTNYNPWWLLFGVGNPSPISTDSGLADGDLLEDLSGLTETQRFLIKYIKEEKNAAEHMARLLWKKALEI